MTAVLQPQSTTQTIWQIDPSHSLVEFSVRHMMFTTVKGSFTSLRGTIVTDEANPAQTTVEADIDVASITTRDEQRDAHLRSPDFFDVEQYPTMSFRSARVEPVDDDTFHLIGDLTIRGITRTVTFTTTVNGHGINPWGQEVAGATAETTINRQDFGLTWNAALEAGGVLVGDKVKIQLEIQAVKQAE